MFDENTPVEEILLNPQLVTYFIRMGVSPFGCSGDFPGSLGRLLTIRHVADPAAFIRGLNEFAAKRP